MKKVESVDALTRYGALKKGMRAIPYGMGNRSASLLLSLWGRAASVRGGSVAEFRSFKRYLSGNAATQQDVVRFLMTNHFASWRLYAISKLQDASFHRAVNVIGLEHIQRPLAAGRGVVICNSHYGAGKLILLPLLRLGLPVASFDRRDVFSYMGVRHSELVDSIVISSLDGFHLKEMMKARRVLREGGILHIASDGLRGTSGIEADFLGRKRRFSTSFAELAITNGAAIIAVKSYINQSGEIHVEFLEDWTVPLDHKYPDGAGAKVLANTLTQQYVNFLAEQWRMDPASVFANEIHDHLSGIRNVGAEDLLS